MTLLRTVFTSVATLAALAALPISSSAAIGGSQYWNTGQAIRLSGADRYETAVEVSEYEFGAPGVASTIVVASGENYPDALVAGPLASLLNAPLILTGKDSLPEIARKNIKWVFDGVADAEIDIYVVGGTSAVSDSVVAELQNIHPNIRVERLAGIDRYETARLVAGRFSSNDSIFLANGASFPDALAASGPASDRDVHYNLMPILLVKGTMLDPNLHNWISERVEPGILKSVSLVGGTDVLDSRVEGEIEYIAQQQSVTVNIARLSGNNRYETARAVAQHFYPMGVDSIGIASGENFPDALVGGQDSGKAAALDQTQAFLLTPPDSLHSAVVDFVNANAASLNSAVVYGGVEAVSEGTRLQLESLL